MALFGKKKKRNQLGAKEQDSLHIVEFSQGRPNEISFNVLEGMASQQSTQKQGWLSRTLGRGRTDATEDMAESAITGALTRDDIPLTASSEQSTTKGRTRKKRTVAATAVAKSKSRTRASGGAKRKSVSSGRPAHQATGNVPRVSRVMEASSQAEVERRHARRRRARIVSTAIIGVVLVGLLGFGGYQAYLYVSDQMDNVNLLHKAIDEVAESDDVLVAVDDFFQKPFDEDSVKDAENLKGRIPDARKKLESAREHAQRSQQELNEVTRDKETSEALLLSIEARERLYNTAEQKLDEDIAAKNAADYLDDAWSKMQQANALLSEQALIISDTTNENVDTSTKYLTEAKDLFTQARADLDEVLKTYESVNLEISYQYIDKRLEAIEFALTSNEAILIQDRKTAETNNERYNKADRESVELAKQLPDSFNQPVVDVYTQRIATLDSDYAQARQEIGTYDATIRDYLESVSPDTSN